MKKKVVIGISIICMLSNPIICHAGSDFDNIEPENLTNDELVDAYIDLRDTYDILFDLYSKELMKSDSGVSTDNILETIKDLPDEDIEKIINKSQNELKFRKNNPVTMDGNNDFGNWIVKNYVDQFNDPTDDVYISYNELLEGTFSNSATSESLLYAKLLIDDEIDIMLYEYGKNQVTSYSSKEYNMIIRDGFGNKTQISAGIRKNGDRIFIPINNKETVLDILKSGGEIKIYLEEHENPITNYSFTIPDATGFDSAYDSTVEKFNN